jgi:Ca2+-binding EF-hand superfamily protein
MKNSTRVLATLAASVAFVALGACEHYQTGSQTEAAVADEMPIHEMRGATDHGPHGKGHGPRHDGDHRAQMAEMQAGQFAAMDENQDGKVSAVEHDAAHDEKFSMFDGDDSGAISLEEFIAVRMGPGPREGGQHKHQDKMMQKKKNKFAKIDTDKDGQVTKTEFSVFAANMFTKADTDGDGYMSQGEFTAHHSHKAKHKGPAKGQGKGHEKHAKMKAHFDAMDANSDGVVSVAEHDAAHLKSYDGDEAGKEAFLAKPRAEFATADTDGDGSVSWEEFHAKHMAEM